MTSADSTTYKYRDETFPPLTPFEVRVGVYNNKGDGPFSGVVTVFSAEGGERLSAEFIAVNNMQLNDMKAIFQTLKNFTQRPIQGFERIYCLVLWLCCEEKLKGKLSKYST